MICFSSPFRLLAVALCFSACLPDGHAQSPARAGQPSSHPATAPAASAHVRLWKTDLKGFPALRVTLTPAGGTPRQHPAARELGNVGPGYVFDNYADLPAGRGTLEVFDAPGAAHPLVSSPAELAPGAFVTVLLGEPTKAGAPPQLEIIVDSAGNETGDGEASAQIRVRSFVTVKDIRVTAGDALNAQFSGSGGYLRMQGLKPAVYPIKTVGTGTDGKSFGWTTEADLRQHHSQTLLIFPDPYGRVRPRMSVDGEVLAAPSSTNDEGR